VRFGWPAELSHLPALANDRRRSASRKATACAQCCAVECRARLRRAWRRVRQLARDVAVRADRRPARQARWLVRLRARHVRSGRARRAVRRARRVRSASTRAGLPFGNGHLSEQATFRKRPPPSAGRTAPTRDCWARAGLLGCAQSSPRRAGVRGKRTPAPAPRPTRCESMEPLPSSLCCAAPLDAASLPRRRSTRSSPSMPPTQRSPYALSLLRTRATRTRWALQARRPLRARAAIGPRTRPRARPPARARVPLRHPARQP